MAINFPTQPQDNQLFVSGKVAYTYSALYNIWSAKPLGTALPFNYIVNPAMQISQQNGDTAGTGNARYGVDQFYTGYISDTAVITTQRVQVATPKGSKDRYRITVTTGDSSSGPTEYLFIRQNIEGTRVADLQYGTASAKQTILRFGFNASASGVYGFSLQNQAIDRCYLDDFYIAPAQVGIDTEQIFVIPGDTTGTWLKDINVGLRLSITISAGSTYQQNNSPPWRAGNSLGTYGLFGGPLYPAGKVFELFDVGLYADPNNTGLPPPWECMSDTLAMMEARRYWYKQYVGQGITNTTTAISRAGAVHPVPMRSVPGITLVGSPTIYDGSASGTLSAPSSAMNDSVAEFSGTVTTLTASRSGTMAGSSSAYIALSSRM